MVNIGSGPDAVKSGVSGAGQQTSLGRDSRAPSADPLQSTRIIGLPYTAPNGRIHSSVRSPQWIGGDTVVFLAEQLFYEGSTFFPDTFYTGLDVALFDLSSGTPELQVIPGTDYASSVAVSEDGEALYYTLGGDSRILKRVLATGEVTTAYDFGSGVIARDVQVRGRYLAAVVGRSVLYRFEDAHGYVQRDEGGDLALVDLVGGTTALFSTDSVLFRHPVISPDGARLVVEVQPFAPVHSDPDRSSTRRITALTSGCSCWTEALGQVEQRSISLFAEAVLLGFAFPPFPSHNCRWLWSERG